MKRAAILCVVLGVVCAVSACSAPEMKGTPFYTGEYADSEGPPEDRVNLWPLLYYRKPALSVLWPIGEYVKGEHLAVRPFFSVYQTDQDRPIVNVLWPLGRFGPHGHGDRFFPAFWGKSGGDPYFVLFPVVWYERNAHAGIFPLFLRYVDPAGTSLHILWPIFNWKTNTTGDPQRESGARLWPLYGQYCKGSRSRRYALWPLAMHFRDGEDAFGWAAPLYFGGRSPRTAWDVLLPLFFRYRTPEVRGLGVLPFYYSHRDDDGRLLVTPVYMSGRKTDSAWDLVLPFFYRSANPDGRLLVTPLYMSGRKADSAWDVILPFFFRSQTPKSSTTVGLPLYFSSERGSVREQLVLPLFYRWTDGAARMLLTLPFGFRESGPTRTIYAFPLLSAYSKSPEGRDLWFLFPLGRAKWGGDADRAHVFPFFYWDEEDALFLSPLFSRKGKGDKRFVNVLGPLANYSWREDRKSLDLLWPFINFHGGEAGSGSRLFPLWDYRHSADRTKLDVALFLANYSRTADRKQFSTLLGLIGATSDKDGHRHHAWPFYRFERDGQERALNLGPFLPGDFTGETDAPAISLLGASWGKDGRRSYAWPLYRFERDGEKRTLNLGPFVPADSSAESDIPAVSLLGASWGDGTDLWAFPLFYDRKTERRTYLPVADSSTAGQEASDEHTIDVRHRSFTAFPLIFSSSDRPLLDTYRQGTAGDGGRTAPVPIERGSFRTILASGMLEASARFVLFPLLWYERDRVAAGRETRSRPRAR